VVKPKVRIVACADNFHFIKDLIPVLSEEFDIQTLNTSTKQDRLITYNRLIEDCNLMWLEWADGYPIELLDSTARYSHFYGNKIILRLHRYELFTPRTTQNIAALPEESIDSIDKLVFVSKKVQQIGIEKFPWMADSVVVPHLIDHTKFPFTDREQGFNIMMLGRMSYVKNIPLALSMFHELWKKDSRYQLHLVGNIPDPELVYYKENFIMKTANPNIHYYGWIDNDKLPRFMEGMHYILCSSVFEGYPAGILEGMCCGLKPIIFNFPGAEHIYPKTYLWIDYEQFESIISWHVDNSIDHHNWAVENCSIEKNIYLYKELIHEVLNERN